MVRDAQSRIDEVFPWDLDDRLQAGEDMLIVDIREPYEYARAHIEGSLNVPRGILESACEWDYEDTVPELVQARDRPVVLACRSGQRSAVAALVLRELGFERVTSLKTGLRGWSDYELPLVNGAGAGLDQDSADENFTSVVRADQMRPR